jgi:hypothetical protein
MNLFTQLGLTETAEWVLKIIAAVGGAFIGWFVSDPLARLTYRLAVHKAIPGWTLPFAKFGGAALLAANAFMLVSLGGGPGGLGFGPGLGSGVGKGPGEGGKDRGVVAPNGVKKTDDAPSRPDKDKTKPADKSPEKVVSKKVEIEVLGGNRYAGDDRWYLLRPGDKALTLKEVEALFKDSGGKLLLDVVLTDDSPDEGLGITEELRRLADRYQISSQVHRPEAKKNP